MRYCLEIYIKCFLHKFYFLYSNKIQLSLMFFKYFNYKVLTSVNRVSMLRVDFFLFSFKVDCTNVVLYRVINQYFIFIEFCDNLYENNTL